MDDLTTRFEIAKALNHRYYNNKYTLAPLNPKIEHQATLDCLGMGLKTGLRLNPVGIILHQDVTGQTVGWETFCASAPEDLNDDPTNEGWNDLCSLLNMKFEKRISPHKVRCEYVKENTKKEQVPEQFREDNWSKPEPPEGVFRI